MKWHLTNGRLVDPLSGKDESMEILVVDGKLDTVARKATSDRSFTVVDLKNCLIMPGLMDMHVHLREPGFEHKETIETGCASAAAGGFTAVCCMPNTNPAIDDESVARYVREKGKQVLGGIVDVFPIAAVTKGRLGEELAPMAELAAAGAVGFSDDGAPVSSAELMRRALEYSSMYGLPVIQHAEETSLTKGGCMHEGFQSTRLGMPGIPRVAEEIMVARDILLLRYVPNARYHVAHVSTHGTMEIVRRAKKEGLSVTCEVTPHHFTLTDEAVQGFDTNTKMNPPLRTGDDVQAMLEGLKDGTIDAIATDHAPHTIDEKEVEFAAAPFGIVGLETCVGLCGAELVSQNILTWSEVVLKLSTNPRAIVGLPPIKIEVGEPANLTIVNPEAEWRVDAGTLRSKSKNTPFNGRLMKGRALGIVNNGQVMFHHLEKP